MPSVMETIYAKARAGNKRITLPEADDVRMVAAARNIVEQGLAQVVLINSEEKIAAGAKQAGVDLAGCRIVDPATSPLRERYAKSFHEMRKSKGITEDQAYDIVGDPLYFGCMMVHSDEADGQVSGATHSTADTVRPCCKY